MEQIQALTGILTQIHAVPIMRCLVYTVTTDLSTHNRDNIIADKSRSPSPPRDLGIMGECQVEPLGPSPHSQLSDGLHSVRAGCLPGLCSLWTQCPQGEGRGQVFWLLFSSPSLQIPLQGLREGGLSVTTQRSCMTLSSFQGLYLEKTFVTLKL